MLKRITKFVLERRKTIQEPQQQVVENDDTTESDERFRKPNASRRTSTRRTVLTASLGHSEVVQP